MQSTFQQKFLNDQSKAIEAVRDAWQQIVKNNINELLQKRCEPTWTGVDDDIFGAHTCFINFAIKHGDPLPAIRIWEEQIAPAVHAAEATLAKKLLPQARIHKGAPLFNVGVACYVAGNLERAFGYVAAAGEENEKSGRGNPFSILIGDNELSRRFLIKPIVDRYFPMWAEDYRNITNHLLDELEFTSILKYLATRPSDAIQILLALHKLLKSDLPFENYATKQIRTRALAEGLVCLESNLRRFQAKIDGELHAQLTYLVAKNPSISASFENFKKDFDIKAKPDQKRTPVMVNWMTAQAQLRLASEKTIAGRAGIVCFLVLKLRNNLLHVIEDKLDLFDQKPLCERLMGLILASIRLAKHGEENTLTIL